MISEKDWRPAKCDELNDKVCEEEQYNLQSNHGKGR